MLDSDRLSSLLKEALSWSDHVSSLLVSATNGSILAYGFRDETPKIKDIRTQSTTMMTAYAMSSGDLLVFEAQDTGAVTVITPVGDQVLLGVTGPKPKHREPLQNGHSEDDGRPAINGTPGHKEQGEEYDSGQDTGAQLIRGDLEVVSQDLAMVLREELTTMRWPDDI